MTVGADPATIKDIARKYLASAPGIDPGIRRSSVMDEPRPVLSPDRRPHSWLVGVRVDGRLVGFVQMLLDGTVMRYSMFPRVPGRMSETSAAELLNPAKARERIAAAARESQIVDGPFLTFDRNPDRLVWAAVVKTRHGTSRVMFAAGDSVYEAPARTDTFG
jgi:hypothetical protein